MATVPAGVGSRKRRVLFGFVVLSLAGHALLATVIASQLAPSRAQPPLPPPKAHAHLDLLLDSAGDVARRARAVVARDGLIGEARAARQTGKLKLGDFLLRANAIDAAEEATPFDFSGAERAFALRVRDLEIRLRYQDVTQAAPAVFSDLSYAGLPGGRMGDTLLKHSGSCEPTSQLVAASLYDAGLGDQVKLRYYGGATAGITHLAAVWPDPAGERDLTSGALSRAGGARFDASELVEIYARAHRAPEEARPRSGSLAATAAEGSDLYQVPITRTLASGYPDNNDRFDAPLPLFGQRAVAERVSDAEASELNSAAQPCEALVPLSWLDPPEIVALSSGHGSSHVALVRTPSDEDLERLAGALVAAESERNRLASAEERLMSDACLVALYDHAAIAFSLAGKHEIARRAGAEAGRIRKRAAPFVKELSDPETGSKRRQQLLAAGYGRPWLLLFLDDSDDLTASLARGSADSYAEVLLVSGLIVAPRSRAVGLELAETLKPRRQVDVMHEIFHAHASTRPWASHYQLEPLDKVALDGQFLRRYRVFRAVAFRLWESPTTPAEAIEALQKFALREGIDEDTRRQIAAYYVRNMHGLYRIREQGRAVLQELDAALVAAGLPHLYQFEELALTPSELETLGLPSAGNAAQPKQRPSPR